MEKKVVRKATQAAKPRSILGLANILIQSEVVARAFGPLLGFVVIETAILAGAGVSAGAVFMVMKGVGRLLS